MTTAGISASSRPRSAAGFEGIASFIDRRPNFALPIWMFAYVALLWKVLHRPLWFDELLTYYVAKAPNANTYFATRFLDPTPPLHYLLVRASIALFGYSPFAIRIPSMLGFMVAGLVVYSLVRKRFGGGVGLTALGLMWSSSLTDYAIEARPYGVVLGLFGIAVVSWTKAIRQTRWTWWHFGLAVSLGAMFGTHCFSPPFAAAIGVGELTRSWITRKVDKRVWAALIVPLGVLPFYLPLIRDAGALLCPPAFAPSWIGFPKAYLAVFAPMLPAIGAVALLWMASYRRSAPRMTLARPHEVAFAIACVVAPSITISYAMWSGSPFWLRYCIGSIFGASLILATVSAAAVKRNSSVAVAFSGLILILFAVTKGGTERFAILYENTSGAYKTIDPDLPFVTASGVTFLEMDHREQPDFIRRLYYLTDHDAAMRIHSNIFEGFPALKKRFPIRANVDEYRDFIGRNKRFLVLGTRGYPEDWLLGKLEEDGAEVRLVEKMKTGYQDRELYEVRIPNP